MMIASKVLGMLLTPPLDEDSASTIRRLGSGFQIDTQNGRHGES
jgi:hypothetical protein